MDITELKKRINEEGLSSYRHNLGDRPMRDDEIGLIITPDKWQVYQSHERGGHHIIATFDNESDACELIYKYLKIDKEYDDHKKGK